MFKKNITTNQLDIMLLFSIVIFIVFFKIVTGYKFKEEKYIDKIDTKDITMIPQSLNNIFQVSNLDAFFLQSISLINNINLSYADTIVSQVLDANNIPISGVPISFNLVSSDIGYLDTKNQLWFLGRKF